MNPAFNKGFCEYLARHLSETIGNIEAFRGYWCDGINCAPFVRGEDNTATFSIAQVQA